MNFFPFLLSIAVVRSPYTTVEKIAQSLRKDAEWVMKKIRKGELPAVKSGRHVNSPWIVRVVDIEAYITTLDRGDKREDEERSET